MKDGFSRALARVLVHEGGRADHPQDPGGRTNMGITQRTYDAYRKLQGRPKKDVWTIPRPEVAAIYRRQYWDIIDGDALPDGVDYAVFDAAVNSGPDRAAMWLQRALGERYRSRIDGVVGSETLAAVAAHRDHDALVRAMCERRMLFLRELRTWPTFGKGWTARVKSVQTTAQLWATGRTGEVPPQYIPDGDQKAEIDEAKPAPSTAPGDVAVGGGGVATPGGGAGAEVIDQITKTQEQLSPFAAASKWIAIALTVIAVIGVLAVVGGLAYRFWVAKRKRERADALDLGDTEQTP